MFTFLYMGDLFYSHLREAQAMAVHSMGGSKVQQLYDACDMIFSGKEGPPTLKEIQWLQDLLDTVEAIDVGIQGSNNDRETVDASDLKGHSGLILGLRVTQITYIHIYECEDFSIGVFCFPAGGKLPLHDHPSMVVLSKLLYGAVSVKSYDWISTKNTRGKKSGMAKVVADDQILQAPCKASVLFPKSGGNIHSFTAITPCAILDVLSPPYSEELERPSTYFSETLISRLPGLAILEEKDLPDDLMVVGAPYLGPELILDEDFDY